MNLPECIDCRGLLDAAALAIKNHMEATSRLELALKNDRASREEISELTRLACWREGIRAEAIAHYRMHAIQHEAAGTRMPLMLISVYKGSSDLRSGTMLPSMALPRLRL